MIGSMLSICYAALHRWYIQEASGRREGYGLGCWLVLHSRNQPVGVYFELLEAETKVSFSQTNLRSKPFSYTCTTAALHDLSDNSSLMISSETGLPTLSLELATGSLYLAQSFLQPQTNRLCPAIILTSPR